MLNVEGDIPKPEQERSLSDKIKIGASITSLAFQQSPGNEAVRAWAALNVYSSTGSPLLAGAAVGVVTLAVEGATGASIATTLNSEKETSEKIRKKFNQNNKNDTKVAPGSRASDMALALGIGSGGVIVKRHFNDSQRTFQQDMRTNVRASSLIAGFSAGVAALATGGIDYADRIGFERVAETSVAVLSDWRTYVGAIALAQGYSFVRKKLDKRG